ncbi:hypothetical protein [Anaerobranca gottschalkii]|uniref:Uncharacterized protein n=1 Tax=Anaerobranca gottschalkii DSM 13577 TaxID=1120990 RepID=A0A1I0CQX8_9FIRM|nr:hypothetical protein [Anaerobranca gottschalkii]SET21713.1 hypothetical protein SAMN03080614_10867 [Anaerobranca gottschalkii DSM 13577]
MTKIAEIVYNLTGVNGVLLFAYGFLASVLVVFTFTLLVIIYNLALRSN